MPSTDTLQWESTPASALLKLAWPMVVSTLSVSTMTLVDTLFVSRLGGPSSVAAVGLGGVLTFGLWCFPMGLVRAVKVFVAQALGAGKRDESQPYLGAALAISLAMGLVVTAIGCAVAPLLPFFTATDTSGRQATEYLAVRMLGTCVFLMLTSIQEVRQGFGDSRSVMYATLVGNCTNIVLDYLFMFRLDWGVAGAAWATNIALTVELVLLIVIHARRDGFFVRKATKEHVRRLARLGIPSGIQTALEVGSLSVMVAILSAFSELHAAANQIAIQVLHFAFLPASALGEAGAVLAGQAVGANRFGLVKTVARITLGLAIAYAAACGLALLFGADPIVRGFTQDARLAALTANLFVVVAVFQLFDAANIVARGVLTGTGDVRYVAIVGIITGWLCSAFLTYTLGYLLGCGVFGAWLGLAMEATVGSLVLWRRLGQDRWRAASVAPRSVSDGTSVTESVIASQLS